MNDQQLIRTLNSVGKACFVRYYERAYDPALAQRIEETEPYTHKSCQSRSSHLRSIIRYERGKDALAIVANARNVDEEARKRAAALLAQA